MSYLKNVESEIKRSTQQGLGKIACSERKLNFMFSRKKLEK
jgi:hypothetical protein